MVIPQIKYTRKTSLFGINRLYLSRKKGLKWKIIQSFPHLTAGTSLSPYLVQLPKCTWWRETAPPWSISGKAVFHWAKSLRFRHSNLGSSIMNLQSSLCSTKKQHTFSLLTNLFDLQFAHWQNVMIIVPQRYFEY